MRNAWHANSKVRKCSSPRTRARPPLVRFHRAINRMICHNSNFSWIYFQFHLEHTASQMFIQKLLSSLIITETVVEEHSHSPYTGAHCGGSDSREITNTWFQGSSDEWPSGLINHYRCMRLVARRPIRDYITKRRKSQLAHRHKTLIK